MAAARHYDYVPTATMTDRGRRVGRPPVPKSEKLLYEARTGMTKKEQLAFEEFKKAHCLDADRTALRKILLERLKADGFLKD